MAGPNTAPSALVPVRLNEKKYRENSAGDQGYPAAESGVEDLKPFRRAQHGNGRSDHAVAIQQRGTEKHQQRQHS